nr:hypothetical protein [Streptomyces sp. WAC 05379]
MLKGALREFKTNELAARGAALAYYGILTLITLLGIVGQSATQQVPDNIQRLAHRGLSASTSQKTVAPAAARLTPHGRPLRPAPPASSSDLNAHDV